MQIALYAKYFSFNKPLVCLIQNEFPVQYRNIDISNKCDPKIQIIALSKCLDQQ
jgi:hypothetical protein